MDSSQSLTLRSLYSLLTGRLPGYRLVSVFSPDAMHGMTLIRFWHDFLANILPETSLTLFDTENRRSRSLSILMNRSKYNSCPLTLYRELEANLNEEALLRCINWFANLFSVQVDPWLINSMLSDYEAACLKVDDEYKRCSSFLDPLRQIAVKDNEYYDYSLFSTTLYLTWLSLHALYGDKMNRSRTLRSLRISSNCLPQQLWQRFYQFYTVKTPDKQNTPTTPAALPEACSEDTSSIPSEPTEPSVCDSEMPGNYPDSRITAQCLHKVLDRRGFPAETPHDGWYCVANWSEPHIALNSLPKPTYDGAQLLGLVPNGALVYITKASGYNGLRNSPGCWGYTCYDQTFGYVPMNFLVRLFL